MRRACNRYSIQRVITESDAVVVIHDVKLTVRPGLQSGQSIHGMLSEHMP
jgi:hypothetical protein